MSRPPAYALVMIAAVLGEAAMPASASPPVPRVGTPALPGVSNGCPDLRLKLGPAFEVKASDRLLLDKAHERLDVVSGENSSVYDLTKGQEVSVKERDTLSPVEAVPTSRLAKGIPKVASRRGRALRIAETAITLPNGRHLTLSRLYAAIYVLKVGSEERGRYEAFLRDLLDGKACGVPIATLSADLKAKVKPLVLYALFDAISAGKLDDFASWVSYRPLFDAFLSLKETEDFLEIYGYRASEQGRSISELSRLDPNKLWTFAWNAVARIFHDPDFTEFSDLSAYQRDGRVTFTLIGSEPIPGGTGNRYGFYTKAAGDIEAAAVTSSMAMHWAWRQDNTDYMAALGLQPASPPERSTPTRFTGARNGLLVLDVTLDPDDVLSLTGEYKAYFGGLGYRFGQDQAVSDVPGYVEDLIANGSLDVLVRDGHADGDDTHVMVLYPKGWSVEGRREVDGHVDTMHIVFNLDPSATNARLAYADFAAAVGSRFAKTQRPLTYLDGSCWGIEKAWFTLGLLPKSQLVEIASNSPVNFFADTDRSAMRMVLDGVVKGQAFAALRSRLGTLPAFKSGREDQFVLPDDRMYPRAGPLLKIEPQLYRREPGGETLPFTPDGYV